jgi:hypothetical protein
MWSILIKNNKNIYLQFKQKYFDITEISKKYSYICVVLLFFVNPFLSVSFMIFFTMLSRSKDTTWLKLFIFLLAAFMGLIQATRILKMGEASDFPMYMDYFSEAGKMNFFDYMQNGYMKETTKEPVYRIINYLGFYIFSGNFVLFAASLVFAMYFSFYKAIYKFWKTNSKDIRIFIAAIALFTFITENFAITNNLLRQQFAMGIMSYVIAQKVVDNKMNWWLALFACFTHTTMFIYLGILFIKPLYEVIRLKSMLWIFAVFLISGIILQKASFLANLFSFSENLSYGFNRLDKIGIHNLPDVIDNSMVIYLNLALFLLITLKLNYLDTPISRSQIFYTNLILFLMLLCVVFNFAPLLQTRFYITRFFLMPFVIPILFHKNQVISGIYSATIVLFFYVRFFMSFDSIHRGLFFPPVSELMTKNIFAFFL